MAHDWPHHAAVRVRIGLHTGEPHVADEGYLGLDVVRAARICTAARGGQVLISESTRALLGSALPDGVSVFPRGERHLKGIEEPERVYELGIEGVEIENHPDGDASLEPRSTPAPADTPSTEHVIEQRFDELGRRLAAGIEEQVARKLEHAFDRLGAAPIRSDEEDADVENLAARSAALDQKIRAQVDAALRVRGIPPGEEQS